MCVDTYAHECEGQRLMSKIILSCSSTFLMEARSLSQAQSLQIQLVLLAGLLWGSHLCLLRTDLQVDCSTHQTFVWVLGIQIKVLIRQALLPLSCLPGRVW